VLLKSHYEDCKEGAAADVRAQAREFCKQAGGAQVRDECRWIESECGENQTGNCLHAEACKHAHQNESVIGKYICDEWSPWNLPASGSSLLARAEDLLRRHSKRQATNQQSSAQRMENRMLEHHA